MDDNSLIRPVVDNTTSRNGFVLFCPGCKCAHVLWINGPMAWTWNNSFDKPTFKPSLVCNGIIKCHSFITDGNIEFLADSGHELAGKVVALEPF